VDDTEEAQDYELKNPDLYFGDAAVDSFWKFYKSERKFKDFKIENPIKDPR
jgi:hypothetical protein